MQDFIDKLTEQQVFIPTEFNYFFQENFLDLLS